MNLQEIERVMGVDGLAKTFLDDTDAQTLWLIDAVHHLRTVIGVYQTHLASMYVELKEYGELTNE